MLVANLVGFYEYPEFPAGLHGKGGIDAVVLLGDVFQLLDAVDVALQNLAAGSGTGTADGVTGLYDGGDDIIHLDLVVVGTDGIDYDGVFLQFFGQLHAVEGMA